MSSETLDKHILGMITAKTDRLTSGQEEQVRDIFFQELRKNRKDLNRRFLSMKEVGEMLGMSRGGVANMLERGELKSFKIGTKICISYENVEEFLKKKSC